MREIATAMPIAAAAEIETTARATSTRGGDAGLQRPAAQLVEGVRADPHRERERERRPAQQRPVHARRERGPDRDVREVPERVRRMEERDVVAPAARTERVERGPRPRRGHARVPQTTIPPPTLSRRASTSTRPASRHASSRRGSGQSCQKSRMLGPRKRPTPPQPERDDRSGRRQPDSHVELPERPPHAAREPELEHRHRAAGPDDPGELTQRRRHVVDVAQEVREGEGVELPVGEGQVFGPSLAQLDPLAQSLRARPARFPLRASPGSGRRPPRRGSDRRARARSPRPPSRSRRRARGARRPGSARRETSATAGPARRRGAGRSGRTSGRAARTAHARAVYEWRPRPYSGRMTVAEDVARIASAAAAFAEPGEEVAGVLVAETLGRRVYLCAFESAGGHAWLAFGDDAEPLTERRLVHGGRLAGGALRGGGGVRGRRQPPRAPGPARRVAGDGQP